MTLGITDEMRPLVKTLAVYNQNFFVT